jgi:hypothetical protein
MSPAHSKNNREPEKPSDVQTNAAIESLAIVA